MVCVKLGQEKKALKEETEIMNETETAVKAMDTEADKMQLNIPKRNSSFFCLSLRTGTLIIGYFYCVAYVILFAVCSMITLALATGEIQGSESWTNITLAREHQRISMMAPPTIILAKHLLIGVHKRQNYRVKRFLRPLYFHLGADVICWILNNFLNVEVTESETFATVYYQLFSLFTFLIHLYSLVVVKRYWKILEGQTLSKRQAYVIPI